MNLPSQSLFKSVTLLLVFCLADACVFANANTPQNTADDAATKTSSRTLVLGRLFVPHHIEILVNEWPAESGYTIISGSRILTNFFSAKVEIRSVGEIQIAPNTDLVLTFDDHSIDARVSVGDANVTTVGGAKGSVSVPDGKTRLSNIPNGPNPAGKGSFWPVPCRSVLDCLLKNLPVLITIGAITIDWIKDKTEDKKCFLRRNRVVSPISPADFIAVPCYGHADGTVFGPIG